MGAVELVLNDRRNRMSLEARAGPGEKGPQSRNVVPTLCVSGSAVCMVLSHLVSHFIFGNTRGRVRASVLSLTEGLQ